MTATENGRSLGEFRMPDVGEGLTEAEIIEWYVEPGDTVSDGQLICEVESAKSAVELPIPFDGVVHEILAPVGSTVEVGAVIILIDQGPARSPLADPRRGPVAEPEGWSPLAPPPRQPARTVAEDDTGDHEQVRWTPVNGGPTGWSPVADERIEPRRYPMETGERAARRPTQPEQTPPRRPPAGRPGSTEQGGRSAYPEQVRRGHGTDPGQRPPAAQRSPLADPQRRVAGEDRGERPANDVRRPPTDEHGERRHPTGEQAARPSHPAQPLPGPLSGQPLSGQPLSGQPRRPPASEWPTRPPSRPVADRGRPQRTERTQQVERSQVEPPASPEAAPETAAQPIVPDLGPPAARAPEWATDLFVPADPEPIDPDRGFPPRRPVSETRPVPPRERAGDSTGGTAATEPVARGERPPVTAPFPVRAAAERVEAAAPAPAAEEPQPERPLAKPPVRKLARDLGVELAEVRASGPNGVVTREDVHAARERAGQDEAVEREVAALQALVDVGMAELPAHVEEPVAQGPVAQAPAAKVPVVEEPVVEVPVVEVPVVEVPVAEVPVAEVPVVGAPVVGAPVVGAPVAEVPVAEVPVVGAPVAGAPDIEEPGTAEPGTGQPVEPEEALPAGVLDTLSAAYPAGPATDLMISWSTVSSVSQDEGVRRVPVTGVRKATARAMVTSAFTAPHVTEFVTVDVTRTMKLVASLKEDPVFAGVRVGPLLIVAKALMVAVSRNPGINAAWDEERQEIVQKERVNLGIAAATPRGLIVPNIPDAGRFTLRQLAGELDQLVGTARAGRTQPGAMRDGTITITNIGVFGVDTGTPILNPGEAAILAFGAVKELPWVHRGEVRPRKVTTLALSFDHRVVDGELGSHVLSDVAAILERPKRLFAWT